jgi:hypothetical protein
MPRAMDSRLVMAHERANPATCYMVDVAVPDVAQVLRRAADQFLASPPQVSESPAGSLVADPAGALTMSSTSSTLASFTHLDDATTTHIDAAGLTDTHVRGLCWTVDPAMGRTMLRSVTVNLKRDRGITQRVALMIYRRDVTANGIAFTPLMDTAVVWNNPGLWPGNVAVATFDFIDRRVELGGASTDSATALEYYLVLSIPDGGSNDLYFWTRDRTASRTIASVGTFKDRQWTRSSGGDWIEVAVTAAVPCATIAVSQFVATGVGVYALDLGATPNADSEGRIVFDRAAPAGTSVTLELSTAGSGGPWTVVTDGDLVTTKQQTYHARVSLTSTSDHHAAPQIAAFGVEFRTPVDVSAEATVTPIAQAIDVPFLAASIGEGSVSIVRTGARDYRDQASDLATTTSVSDLEVDVRLGSRHPLVPRSAWMLRDRATVNNRTPSSSAESFNLLSILKLLKQKIPQRQETFNELLTVASSVSDSTETVVVMTTPIPDGAAIDAYLNQQYYIRVHDSDQPGVLTGLIAPIYNGSSSSLVFQPPLPNDFAPGDLLEIHSARYTQPVLSWKDADPADIWWEIFTVHCLVPPERIGRGDMGSGGRSGLPPRVTDRAPGDPESQAKLLVTMQTKEPESAADLINQLSFIMGGATVDIGGQIVYRQIYPVRDPTGLVVIAPEPVAATFDVRNTTNLDTPTGLEQRITQLASNYGADATAGVDLDDNSPTAVFVDGDAMAWLKAQPVDEMATSAIPKAIARWCFNSTDAGLYLATQLIGQVVRAASTGLRNWSWSSTESQPRLVVGDRVTVITDQYTDYDPARNVPVRGTWSYVLVLINVADGGTSFHGFMLGLADAVQIAGGPGTREQPQGSSASEMLGVTWQDSADGTQRTYDVTAGDAVDTLFVHHRLWPVGTAGDPFDFATDTGELIIVRPDPLDGHFRFTLVHPARDAQRFAILVARSSGVLLTGSKEVFKITLDPAAPAMDAKMHAAVTNGTADISVDVTAGISDWPVHVEIFEGSPTGTPLVETDTFGPITLEPIGYPALGGRDLPLRELLQWWTILTNVAGERATFGPEAADRDPLPTGYIQIEQNRTDAKIRMVFDDDTDTIRVTVPNGKTKTWDAAALDLAGSPVVYTVGDLLDDATTESALGVDEKRGTYLVEYQGGGVWVTVAPPFILAGPLSVVSMVVTVTPGPTSYSIVWSGAGVTVNIDGGGYGTPSPSPIVVTRDGSPHTYDFKQVGGNTNAPVHIDIPALTLGAGPLPAIDSFYSPSNSPYSFNQHTTTDIIDLVWSARNPPTGATFDLDWALDGGAHTLITGVSSPYSHQRTGTGGHGLDIANGNPPSRMRYTLILKDGSGNELAVSTLDIEVDHV